MPLLGGPHVTVGSPTDAVLPPLAIPSNGRRRRLTAAAPMVSDGGHVDSHSSNHRHPLENSPTTTPKAKATRRATVGQLANPQPGSNHASAGAVHNDGSSMGHVCATVPMTILLAATQQQPQQQQPDSSHDDSSHVPKAGCHATS